MKHLRVYNATIFLCPVDFRKLYFDYSDIYRPMLIRLLPEKGKIIRRM